MTPEKLSEVTDDVLVYARRSTRRDDYRTAQLIARAFRCSGMTEVEMKILSDMLKIVLREEGPSNSAMDGMPPFVQNTDQGNASEAQGGR